MTKKKVSRVSVTKTVTNGTAKTEPESTPKTDKLTKKFLKVRRTAFKKGVTDEEIKSAFLETDRSVQKTEKKFEDMNFFQKSRSLITRRPLYQIQLSLMVILTAVGLQLGAKDVIYDLMYGSRCIIDANLVMSEIVRPLTNCEACRDLRHIPVERNISAEIFLRKYAYTGVPVIIKGATTNWTAMDHFSYYFFRDLYDNLEDSYEINDEACQFFPYKTDFEDLEDAFDMDDDRISFKEGEEPWYFGCEGFWSINEASFDFGVIRIIFDRVMAPDGTKNQVFSLWTLYSHNLYLI